jgi:hypothetical protein
MAVAPGELLDGIDWVPGPQPSGAFVLGAGSSPEPPWLESDR